MKLPPQTGAALLPRSTTVLVTPDSCERAKSGIQQKITSNGVPETASSLVIVPNDQIDQSEVQVAGRYANGTFEIAYTHNSDNPVENDAQ